MDKEIIECIEIHHCQTQIKRLKIENKALRRELELFKSVISDLGEKDKIKSEAKGVNPFDDIFNL